MALEWKKVLTTGDNTNIGNSNFTLGSNVARSLTLGSGSSSFSVNDTNGLAALNVGNSVVTLGSASTGAAGFTTSTVTFLTGVNTAVFGNTDSVKFTSTKNDATSGPDFLLTRDRVGVADDLIGRIAFQGENADGATLGYSAINTKILDPTTGAASGSIDIKVQNDGSQKEALTIEGGGLTSSVKLSGNTLEIKDTDADENAGPILELFRESASEGNDDFIGKVEFNGYEGGANKVESASMGVQRKQVGTGNEYADIIFSVKEKNVDQTVTFTKSGEYQTGDEGNSDTQTENESKLKAIEIRGTSLEELTRRTQMVYQCGFNGVIQTNTTQNVYKDQMARVSNGVQMIDGSDYTNSTGIVMPFDGYLVGGSFSCVRHDDSESNTGFVKFYAKKYTPSGTGDWDDDVLIASAVTSSSEVHPVSESYLIDNGEIRADAVKVLRGDMILPYFSVATSTNGSDYRIDDVIAQFIIYSESTFQVTA